MNSRGGSGRAPAASAAARRRAPLPAEPTGTAEALAHLLNEWRTTPIRRRTLLAGAATLAALAATGPLACLRRRPTPEAVARAAARLDRGPWPTLAAVHDHLFPDDGNGPSARDIHATVYLRALLDDPEFDPEEASFIHKGVGWLDDLAMKRAGAPFADLDTTARERTLREVAASDTGESWLATLLLYLFEALLADPIYGGNPDGIGWRWLDHQPGFPRPTANQTYPKLRTS